jgi:hypothetical protein
MTISVVFIWTNRLEPHHRAFSLVTAMHRGAKAPFWAHRTLNRKRVAGRAFIKLVLFMDRNLVQSNPVVIFDILPAANFLQKKYCFIQLFSFSNMQTSFIVPIFIVFIRTTLL